MLRVTSVNVGRARLIPGAESVGPSGIYKLPQHHAVAVTAQGLEGDAICHTEDHGGPDQAVYAYGGIDYRWWATELQRPVEPGTFGENLTINGMRRRGYPAEAINNFCDVVGVTRRGN